MHIFQIVHMIFKYNKCNILWPSLDIQIVMGKYAWLMAKTRSWSWLKICMTYVPKISCARSEKYAWFMSRCVYFGEVLDWGDFKHDDEWCCMVLILFIYIFMHFKWTWGACYVLFVCLCKVWLKTKTDN